MFVKLGPVFLNTEDVLLIDTDALLKDGDALVPGLVVLFRDPDTKPYARPLAGEQLGDIRVRLADDLAALARRRPQ